MEIKPDPKLTSYYPDLLTECLRTNVATKTLMPKSLKRLVPTAGVEPATC
jgi:hypothetical protein